jgi:hypothetical protein
MARWMSWSAVLAGVALLAVSCRERGPEPTTFVWRAAGVEVAAASDRVADSVFRQMQAVGTLPQGYPQQGHMVSELDPTHPGAERISCSTGLAGSTGDRRCILLGEADEFIQVQPVTWQSAAFFMYRIYVTPRSPFARLDPAKDFVAVDVISPDNAALWQAADAAIRSAASELGARPFRP